METNQVLTEERKAVMYPTWGLMLAITRIRDKTPEIPKDNRQIFKAAAMTTMQRCEYLIDTAEPDESMYTACCYWILTEAMAQCGHILEDKQG